MVLVKISSSIDLNIQLNKKRKYENRYNISYSWCTNIELIQMYYPVNRQHQICITNMFNILLTVSVKVIVIKLNRARGNFN
jgi:hypothetical protein